MEPKVHYHVNKIPALVPTLSQMNPIHILPPNFLKIHFHAALCLCLPSSLFPSGFQPTFLYAFLISQMNVTCPTPSHHPWFDHFNNIQWRVQIMEPIHPSYSQVEMPASDHNVLLDIDDFRFHMNQPSCQGTPVLVALVHSAPRNRDKRLQIRNTWGSVMQGTLLFVLGEVDSPLLQVQCWRLQNFKKCYFQCKELDTYCCMLSRKIIDVEYI
jgi:hypothetical protein